MDDVRLSRIHWRGVVGSLWRAEGESLHIKVFDTPEDDTAQVRRRRQETRHMNLFVTKHKVEATFGR